jgi:peptidoglycan/LPS O-acetylase OafA/YrhL
VLGAALVCWSSGTVDFQDGQYRPTSVIGISFVDISFAALLIGILASKSQLVLDQQWLRTFGKYSYGIYLFHGFIPNVVMHRLSSESWIHIRLGVLTFIISRGVASF